MLGLLGASSPLLLEGSGPFRAQYAEADLKKISRHEWCFGLSAFFVTLLSATAAGAFFRSALSSRARNIFYEIRPEQARWGAMSLLLLFQWWLVYRQWSFRAARDT